MPNYEIEHICPLTESQKDEIAEAITHIHTEQFKAPRLFVNCRFTNIKDHAVYVAGKRVGLPLRLAKSCPISHFSCPYWFNGHIGQSATMLPENNDHLLINTENKQPHLRLRPTRP